MTEREFEDWKSENRNDFHALINLANDEGCEELFNDLISTDDVDDFVRERLDNGGWQGVACCISDIVDNMSDDFYEIDGYGNLTTCSDWDSYADDLENELVFDQIDCDRGCENVEETKYAEDWAEEQGKGDDFIEKLKNFLSESTEWSEYDEICEDCFDELAEKVDSWDGEMDSDEFEESLENEEDSDEE